MTLKKIFAPVIGVCILFAGCNIFGDNDDINPETEFKNKQIYTIRSEEIKLAGDSILFKPFDFQIYDTLAVINDNTGEAGYSIINLKTGKLLKKFAFSGSGSSDFDINSVSMNASVDKKSTFSVVQVNSPCKVFVYKWDSLLTTAVYKPNPFYYPKHFGFLNTFLLNDSTLFGRISFSKFDNKMFGALNMSSNKLLTGIDAPNPGDDTTYSKWLKIVMDDKVKYRPGSAYEFASFSYNGATVQIFKLDQDHNFQLEFQKIYYLPLFHIIKSPNYTKPTMDPGTKSGFGSIAVTKDKIYALYNGPSLDNERNDPASNTILVYDWTGKPVEKIKLDRHCGRIAIDENNPGLLYGLCGEMNTHIVRYKINDLHH